VLKAAGVEIFVHRIESGVDRGVGDKRDRETTDLLRRGDVMVSARAISLHGSLKSDILYVGVTP
jgi:hypothetical protein